MFGSRIDYQLLKPLTHDRLRATEAELDARAEQTRFSFEDARAYLQRVSCDLFRGDLKIDPSLSYLDIGCGMGRLSLGLALAGCTDVTGLDIVKRNVLEASRLAEALPADVRPTFVHGDVHDWEAQREYDVVIVLGAMEHIHDQDVFLKALPRFLEPDGRAFVSIEPFHSPFGDHMMGFFKVPIPWMGLLFDEQAVLRLRRERFRPTDRATRYQDIQGGLNLVRYGKYLENVHEAGLEFEANHVNPQLWHRRRFLPIRPVSRMLTSIPGVRDYFVVCDYGVVRRRSK